MKLSKIERLILAYLRKHPDAKDTERGILEWWLLEEEIANRASSLKRAIAHLVSAEFILKKGGPNTEAYYTVNPERFEDITNLVGKSGY